MLLPRRKRGAGGIYTRKHVLKRSGLGSRCATTSATMPGMAMCVVLETVSAMVFGSGKLSDLMGELFAFS